MALNKTGVIEKLTEQMKIDKETAAKSVEIIIESIKSSLADGEDVMITGFGKFCVNEKNERKGRNPDTGEDLQLPARKRIDFKCSQKLRARMNGEKG
jgi:integration host factor subunit alpha